MNDKGAIFLGAVGLGTLGLLLIGNTSPTPGHGAGTQLPMFNTTGNTIVPSRLAPPSSSCSTCAHGGGGDSATGTPYAQQTSSLG